MNLRPDFVSLLTSAFLSTTLSGFFERHEPQGRRQFANDYGRAGENLGDADTAV
jgi:hypothetical protein